MYFAVPATFTLVHIYNYIRYILSMLAIDVGVETSSLSDSMFNSWDISLSLRLYKQFVPFENFSSSPWFAGLSWTGVRLRVLGL